MENHFLTYFSLLFDVTIMIWAKRK